MNESTQKPKLFSFKNFFHDFVRVTGAPVALWFRPKRIYTCEKARKIPKGGLLLIANHTDFADPVYMMLGVWQRRQFFLVSEELMDSRHGRLFRACRCIRIDRDYHDTIYFQVDKILKLGDLSLDLSICRLDIDLCPQIIRRGAEYITFSCPSFDNIRIKAEADLKIVRFLRLMRFRCLVRIRTRGRETNQAERNQKDRYFTETSAHISFSPSLYSVGVIPVLFLKILLK